MDGPSSKHDMACALSLMRDVSKMKKEAGRVRARFLFFGYMYGGAEMIALAHASSRQTDGLRYVIDPKYCLNVGCSGGASKRREEVSMGVEILKRNDTCMDPCILNIPNTLHGHGAGAGSAA